MKVPVCIRGIGSAVKPAIKVETVVSTVMISKQPVVMARNQSLIIISGLSGYRKYSVVFTVEG